MTGGTNIHDGGSGRYVGGETPTRDDHLATKGYVDAHSGSISVTDGTHTVNPASELDFTSGATVTDAGGGVAQVAISGGGAQAVAVTGPFTIAYNAANLQNPSDNGVLVTGPIAAGSFVDVVVFYSAEWTGSQASDEMVIALAPSLGVFGSTIAELDIFNTAIGSSPMRQEMRTLVLSLVDGDAIRAPSRLRCFAAVTGNVYAAAYPAGTLTGGNAIIYVITYTPA